MFEKVAKCFEEYGRNSRFMTCLNKNYMFTPHLTNKRNDLDVKKTTNYVFAPKWFVNSLENI